MAKAHNALTFTDLEPRIARIVKKLGTIKSSKLLVALGLKKRTGGFSHALQNLRDAGTIEMVGTRGQASYRWEG